MEEDLRHVWSGLLFTQYSQTPANIAPIKLHCPAKCFEQFRTLGGSTPPETLTITTAGDKFISKAYPEEEYFAQCSQYCHCQIEVDESKFATCSIRDAGLLWRGFVQHMSGWRVDVDMFLPLKRKLAIIQYGPYQGYMLPALYDKAKLPTGVETREMLAAVRRMDCWFCTTGEQVPELKHFYDVKIDPVTGELLREPTLAQRTQEHSPSLGPLPDATTQAGVNQQHPVTAVVYPLQLQTSTTLPQATIMGPILSGQQVLAMPLDAYKHGNAAVLNQGIHAAAMAPAGLVQPPPHGVGDASNSSTNTTNSPPGTQAAMMPQAMGLHSSFLDGLSQNHESWVFGAIAELVDNSRDAAAHRLDIYVMDADSASMTEDTSVTEDEGKRPILVVEDNGCGMDYTTMLRAMSMGHKKDAPNPSRIGCYGFGLKSGSIRIGNDVLVLSIHKHEESKVKTACISLLSMTYNKDKDMIVTPILPLTWPALELDETKVTRDVADKYWSAIQSVSGFSRSRVLYELGTIRGTGTRILIWNLRQRKKGYELQWRKPPGQADIFLAEKMKRNREGQVRDCEVPIDWSLKAYLQCLYSKRKMHIHIQNIRIETANQKTWRDKMSKLKEYSEEVFIDDRKVQLSLLIGVIAEEKKNRNCGVMLFHKERLIQSYQRLGLQSFVDKAFGIVGIFEAPPSVIRPTNNKQDFVFNAAWKEVGDWVQRKVLDYYNKHVCTDVAKVPDKVTLEEGATTGHFWAQCDNCSKWRRTPTQVAEATAFYCYHNKAHKRAGFLASCDDPDEKEDEGEVTISVKQDGEAVRSASVMPAKRPPSGPSAPPSKKAKP